MNPWDNCFTLKNVIYFTRIFKFSSQGNHLKCRNDTILNFFQKSDVTYVTKIQDTFLLICHYITTSSLEQQYPMDIK